MFCPGCGAGDRYSTQFCRTCGTDLRLVHNALAKTDVITASAANAREEIGRAFAQKIRETNDAVGLKIVAEEVLPEIEKFLESPEERRLRRFRVGSLISFIGLGAAIAFLIIGLIEDTELLIVAGAGFVTFCIGLSFIINGLFFTNPRKTLPDNSVERENSNQSEFIQVETNELKLPESNQVFASVVEETTQDLQEKQPILRT